MTLLRTGTTQAPPFGESGSENGLKLLDPPGQPSSGSTGALIDDLHDIYGPQPPVEQPPYLLYGLFILVALLSAAALFQWLKKRKGAPAPPIPPGTIARSDLMLARELMAENSAREYLEKLSEILRRYLEARFSLASTRQTTGEFFRSLAGGLSEDHPLLPFQKELQHCLEICDLAKFAHCPATLPTLQEAEQTILTFINSCEPESTRKSGGARR